MKPLCSEACMFKLGMYILSMWILALIVIILSFPISFDSGNQFIGIGKFIKEGWITLLFLFVFLYGIWFYYKLIHYHITGTQEFSVSINSIESRQSDPLAFLASYFVPLVSFQLTEFKHEVVLIILFITIGIMYIKGNLFHMNPTLLLLGFNMYEIGYLKNSEECKTTVISLSILEKADRIRYVEITDNVWFGFKIKEH